MEPEPVLQSIPEFVDEYGPVTTEEVMAVFDLERGAATQKLRQAEDVEGEQFNPNTLWKTGLP